MYTTIEQALTALDETVADIAADQGPEVIEEGWADVVDIVALECTPAVAAELRRTQVGW